MNKRWLIAIAIPNRPFRFPQFRRSNSRPPWPEAAQTVDNSERYRSPALIGAIGGYRRDRTFTGMIKNG